jgi:hypothetical protein
MIKHLKQELADEEGFDFDPSEPDITPSMQRSMTDTSKPQKPHPLDKAKGILTLVSTMQDPRKTIKNSQWATRGWTYQEGVLLNRRLVFTEEQVYWECRSMAACETIDLALNHVHEPSGSCMADYMLSGIFNEDLHEADQLQYGFGTARKEAIGDQVVTLNSHIQNYTSRTLGNAEDSFKAFMGVATSYTSDTGLYLLLGLPIWAGAFANGEPGLQHTFALSLSSWTHVTEAIGPGAGLHVTKCARRLQFPSWTWTGWEGAIEFCNEKQSRTHRMYDSKALVSTLLVLPGPMATVGGFRNVFETNSQTVATDPWHSDFFKVMTKKGWVIEKIWSAEMRIHTPDDAHSACLTGWMPVHTIGNPSLMWLLTIKKPLVLRHMHLTCSTVAGEWRHLQGRTVSVHVSIPMTEPQLEAHHKNGYLVSVLVFASMVPDVYNGIARFLILRQADIEGCWERVGRLNMWIKEKEMDAFLTPEAMVGALPVQPFGENIVVT